MPFEPKIWQPRELVSYLDMNRLEQGLAAAGGVSLDPHPSLEGLYRIGAAAPGPGPDPEPTGTGFVRQMAEATPYESLTVTGIDDAYEMVGYDIRSTRGGKNRTVRLQGPYIAATPGVDEFQRVEEVTLTDGYQVAPRSNMEIAFQLYPTTAATTGMEFVPYHGADSISTAAPTRYLSLDGAPITMPGIGSTLQLPDGLTIEQDVRVRLASAPADQVHLTTKTSFYRNGMIEVSGRWEALVDVKVGSVYAPMTPYQQADIDTLQHAQGTITLNTGVPAATTNQDLPASINGGLLTSTARPQVRLAWEWTDPDVTLRRGKPDAKTTGSVIFAQRRTDGINKVYPHVWTPESIVPAGTIWTFGAQWWIGEVA